MILKTTLTCILAMGLSLGLVQPVAAESRPKAGVLAAANGLVKARDTTDQNAQPRSLAVGGAVYFKDELITPEGVKAQILLKDQTTFALSGNAKMVLDEFVYDPKGKKNRVGASIAKGAFKFVSGKIAKQNTKNMKVKTGNVVVAVRGTEVIGNVQDQQTDVFLISGAIDVTSLASECLASPAAATNNPFAVGSDGNLALSSPPSASAPASCLQSIAQPGFKVVASVVGQISQPVRADPTEIENVINAVTIDPEEAEERTTDEQASDEQASDEQASDEQIADEQASDVATTEQDQTDESERQDAASTSQDTTEQQTADLGDSIVDLDANGQPKTDDSSRSTESEFDKLLIASITGTDDDKSSGSADDLTKTQVELDAFGVPKTDSASEPEREGDEKVTDSGQTLVGEDGKPVDSQAAIEEVKSEEVKDESLEAKSEEVASQYSLTVAALTDYQDTSASDTFSTQNQTATVSGTGSSTYGLSSSSASVRPGFDQEVAGSFGTLYLNTSTGAYEYVPNDSAINQLTTADGTKTDSFVFTASNGISSDSKTLNVAIKGVNDAPTFSLGAINDYAEDTAAADGGFSTQIASAQSISDAESDAVTFSISGGTGSSSEAGYTDSLLGSYGTLHLDSSTGGYKYIPDTGLMEATSATYTESFDIVATDGTSPATETLSFNVKGENDTPVFSNRSYGSWPRIAIVGQVWTGSANSNLGQTVTDRDTDATGKVSKLDLTLVSGPSWLSVAPDGESLTGTPGGTGDGAAGQQVTIQASTEDDGGLASNTQTFTVNVCDSIGNCFLNPGDPDNAAEDRTVANFGGQDILNVSSTFISNTSNTYNVLQGAGLRGSFSGTSTTALEGVTTGGGGTLTTTQTVTVDFGAETAITTVTGEIDGIQKEGAFASGWVDGLRHTFSHTFGSISLQTGTVGGSSGTALRFEQDATTNVVGGNSNTIDIKAGWGIVESKFSTPSKPAVVGYVGVYSGGHSAETDTLRALSTDGSGTPIQKVIVLTPQ